MLAAWIDINDSIHSGGNPWPGPPADDQTPGALLAPAEWTDGRIDIEVTLNRILDSSRSQYKALSELVQS